MKKNRILEITLELNQLRIEQQLETQTRNDRMKELLQELEHLAASEREA